LNKRYDPKTYWEARLAAQPGLRGVGHLSFGARYNDWLYRAKSRALESALRGVSLAGKSVLDVGSGVGYFVQWYSDRDANVTGIDIAENAVQDLRRRFRGEFYVMDISRPQPHAPAEYDIVNTWDVMYHIVDDDGFGRALRFLAEQVRPGGLLLVTDRLGGSSDRQAAAHVRMRCLETYQKVLQPLGMTLLGVHFLYRWLNRRLTLPALDSRLAGVLYWLDGLDSRIPSGNLSLGLWRRIASS
jgi:2-polyprenyl-3-methyl-5-hydroxy-6-metoxy-1,4-benzoquinol methylase